MIDAIHSPDSFSLHVTIFMSDSFARNVAILYFDSFNSVVMTYSIVKLFCRDLIH